MKEKEQYCIMQKILNEKQWRLYLGTEAKKLGRGGISKVSKDSGANRNTVSKGLKELESPFLEDRIRKVGSGRKKIIDKNSQLLKDLESLIEPKGDPMSLLKWTTKSLSNLVSALENMGYTIKKSALAIVLKNNGFSLKANKRNIEGISHPDRDEQFKNIKKTCDEFEKNGNPIISVDCKKKELIGNFKSNGEEWCPKGKNTTVNVYDFRSLADGKVCPYGVYDILQNTGFINLGVDHDTASFAVESIRRWWNNIGKELYPDKQELLITSDSGGSNGARNRLWKKELQKFSNETGLKISITHFPRATSKWNKIDHRLFSYISINWRGKPLTSIETVIDLISSTKTKEGLTVKAFIDKNMYPIGIKVSDLEMKSINIIRNEFHGDWNYIISPNT